MCNFLKKGGGIVELPKRFAKVVAFFGFGFWFVLFCLICS